MEILGLSGSLRRLSTNSALLRTFAREAPDGCRLVSYDGLGDLPIFNPDDEDERTPVPVRDLIGRVRAADGLVISSPEYAHGVPGGLKNALDWLVSRDAAVDKPVMLIHASLRSAISREALREILKTMNMRVFPGPELEIRLLGLAPDARDAVLTDAENRSRMALTWHEYQAFVGDI